MEPKKVKINVQLKCNGTIYRKGLIINGNVPRDIVTEIKSGRGTVTVLEPDAVPIPVSQESETDTDETTKDEIKIKEASEYPCPDCERIFETEHALKIHNAKAHKE